MHLDEVGSGLCANSPRTHIPKYYYMIQPPPPTCVHACVWIFLVTSTHPQWSVFLTRCVRPASCWGASQMVLNSASPGALQTVPSTVGRSRVDLIVCTSECSPQHHCAAFLHIIQSCNGWQIGFPGTNMLTSLVTEARKHLKNIIAHLYKKKSKGMSCSHTRLKHPHFCLSGWKNHTHAR